MAEPSKIRDAYWMKRALGLARRGLGRTAPNPMVGTIVLNRDGEVVGRGYHAKAGEAHAEVIALDQAGERAKGGTLYVTLEPCSHLGKTPPCVDRILASGVARVVVATQDPNPQVDGSGIEQLRQAGLQVEVGVVKEAADRLLKGFRTWVVKGRPYVTAKVALSFDGKLGTREKRVRLTGPVAEKSTMRLRAEAGAILVGDQTVAVDDPRLTVRGPYHDRTPLRLILDGTLKTSPSSALFTHPGGDVWIFCDEQFSQTEAGQTLSDRGARVIGLPCRKQGWIEPGQLLSYLAEHEVNSLLIEGGEVTLSQFSKAGLIDRWVIFLSQTVLGGQFEGRDTVPLRIGGDFPLYVQSVIRRGSDLEITAISKA